MSENKSILQKLMLNPIENAWAIQDFTVWPERSKIFTSETPKGVSYLLITGHPSQDRHPMVILSDAGGDVETLFQHLPQKPFVIRETRASIVPKIQALVPNAKIFAEVRMDLRKENAKLPQTTKARRVIEDDAVALAEFQGAPPQAAQGMKFWIRGAVIMAVFESGKIVSMGTTIVRTDHVWDLAGIETLPDYRRRGLATEVVAALSNEAFKNVSTVSLTVLKDNLPALKTYTKLGFEIKEDRVWIDNGTGSQP
jgi:ribosomal protein S18 acetylase RimI-like enzyme